MSELYSYWTSVGAKIFLADSYGYERRDGTIEWLGHDKVSGSINVGWTADCGGSHLRDFDCLKPRIGCAAGWHPWRELLSGPFRVGTWPVYFSDRIFSVRFWDIESAESFLWKQIAEPIHGWAVLTEGPRPNLFVEANSISCNSVRLLAA